MSTTPEASAEPSYPLWEEPRDGIPEVISTPEGLTQAIAALQGGSGPVAADVERAMGFRYGQRAFLVQLRRQGSGTWLIDPEPFADLAELGAALNEQEWIFHAASQDLPSLKELGIWPSKLYDTELAARLAGMSKVGLATVVEQLLGYTLAKEHSAVDWSTRPLPEAWLRYAALDVDVLLDVYHGIKAELERQGKSEFAREEFEAILAAGVPEPRQDPWRRTSGIHTVRNARDLAIVRELWQARERLAQERDISPSRLIKDTSIVAAAKEKPRSVHKLLEIKQFQGRAAKSLARHWIKAISTGIETTDLPSYQRPRNGPPPPPQWPHRDLAAAQRLYTARKAISVISEQRLIPTENLLTPDYLRRLCWQPPVEITLESVSAQLEQLGARRWQIEVAAPALRQALSEPEPLPAAKPESGDSPA